MKQIDAEIVKGLQTGDQRAYGMMFRLYFQPLSIYAKSILTDSEQSRDIVQEVFLKIWNSRDSLEISISLKSFLYKMVHNACISHLRKEKTRQSVNALSYDDVQLRLQAFDIEGDDHFFDVILSEELDLLLYKAIDQLPPQCKQVFLLRRYGQLPYEEIAQKLSVSLSTIKTQMVRAMEKLKESLEKFLN
jgi:RNA polymerase sigma-70 factor, ECF subfamily